MLNRRLHVNGRPERECEGQGGGRGEEWYKGGTGKEVTRSVWRSRRSQERVKKEGGRKGKGREDQDTDRDVTNSGMVISDRHSKAAVGREENWLNERSLQ